MKEISSYINEVHFNMQKKYIDAASHYSVVINKEWLKQICDVIYKVENEIWFKTNGLLYKDFRKHPGKLISLI